MNINNITNTYIDTLGIRCVCDNKEQRESLSNVLFDFLKEKKIVAIRYNKERSNEYYQITDLLYGNTKLATIAKGYYQNDNNLLNPDYYYVNMNFYGLKRYNNFKDKASFLLVKTITAFLNKYNIDFRLTELDIAMDIETKIENVLTVCVSRSPNVNYYPLGDIDANGNTIQKDDGIYYIEKLSKKQKKNTMSRAYLYDKRKKELDKFKREIGFDLTRFELKLQKRYFVKNEYTGSSLYKAMGKYTVLYFKDMRQKELFIKNYNNTNNSRQRKRVVKKLLDNNNAVVLTPRLNNVYHLLREIDSSTFDSKGDFKYVKHEDYLYCLSKFNRNLK